MRFLREFSIGRYNITIWREPTHDWLWYISHDDGDMNFSLGRVRVTASPAQLQRR